MSDPRYLGIYLNDHLTGQVLGYELTRRCLANNLRTPLGVYLSSFLVELRSDRRVLDDVMQRLGVRQNPVKQAGAWVSEKVGRLKMNGQLRGYSDLSRVEEVEFLSLGTEGRIGLWRALQRVAAEDERLSGIDFDALIKRAQTQRRRLEKYRQDAVGRAFLGEE